MLKLKPQYFGHLMWRADSFVKTLMLGKIEGRKRRGQQRMRFAWHHRLNGDEFGWTPGVGDGQGDLACCSSWGHRVGHDWATELKLQPCVKMESCNESKFQRPGNDENSRTQWELQVSAPQTRIPGALTPCMVSVKAVLPCPWMPVQGSRFLHPPTTSLSMPRLLQPGKSQSLCKHCAGTWRPWDMIPGHRASVYS